MEKLQQVADTLKLEMKQCRHQVQKLEVRTTQTIEKIKFYKFL